MLLKSHDSSPLIHKSNHVLQHEMEGKNGVEKGSLGRIMVAGSKGKTPNVNKEEENLVS